MDAPGDALPAGGPEATRRALAGVGDARAIGRVEGSTDQVARATPAARTARTPPVAGSSALRVCSSMGSISSTSHGRSTVGSLTSDAGVSAGTGSLARVSELSWWFAPHPDWEPTEDWPEEVPVVRYETDDEVVLV